MNNTIRILEISVEDMDNAGCNNGNYPMVTIKTNHGDWHGDTCNCHRGCSGTWNISNLEVGMEFVNDNELLDELEPYDDEDDGYYDPAPTDMDNDIDKWLDELFEEEE